MVSISRAIAYTLGTMLTAEGMSVLRVSIFNIGLLALTALAMAACNTPVVTSSLRQDTTVKSYQLPPDKALIHIYKVTALPLGDTDRIYLNGRFIGEVDEGTFIAALLEAGNYQVERRSASMTRYPAVFSLDVSAGEKVYLARDFGGSKVHLFRQEPPPVGIKRLEKRRLAIFDDRSFATVAAPRPTIQAQSQTGAQDRFPTRPVDVTYRAASERSDDIAVIIGNADYARLAKDIPDVVPAYADAESFRRYATSALGVREGNVIFLKDATNANLLRVFGSDKDHRGQLYDWVVAGQSRVWVYYAGHGAPAGKEGSSYLVPADADGSRIQLNGYALSTLYDNLGRLPARSVTVVLETCFSGASQAGSVIQSASAVYVRPKAAAVPAGVTVIAAGAPDEIASWEQDKSHGLFTKYYLNAMSGEADKSPYGDGDGQVTFAELDAYLKRTLTYFARRYYGRDQTARITVGKGM
ncbi:MAG: hypothetical protein HN403_05055 [Rhodospirillales bacterium]|jgi:hypothetical protein|nr:hypothetical protein [Rhodospirillales bacterium]